MTSKELNSLLQFFGLHNVEIRGEMLDHYLTSYEKLLESGMSVENAKKEILNSIHNINVPQFNQKFNKLYKRENRFRKITLISLITVFILFFLVIESNTPRYWPINSRKIVSEFGKKYHPVKKVKIMHVGVDIIADFGTVVISPANGVVDKTGYDKRKGLYIEIKHNNEFKTKFYHLQCINVVKGQEVQARELIGAVGASGMATSPHLHYEVIKHGVNVDPQPYLKV